MSTKFKKTQALVIFVFLFFLLLAIPGASAQEDEGGDLPETLSDFSTDAVRPSESPYLRNVENPDIEPITPYDGPPVEPIIDPTASISYDMATGETVTVPS